jgi:hypothetical protein
MADVVQTDWGVEEGMISLMTGGVNAPDRLRFDDPPQGAEATP